MSLSKFVNDFYTVLVLINWMIPAAADMPSWKKKKVRVGNMGATMVLRCLSEPESEAGLRSVKISELAQKLTEIATFFQ